MASRRDAAPDVTKAQRPLETSDCPQRRRQLVGRDCRKRPIVTPQIRLGESAAGTKLKQWPLPRAQATPRLRPLSPRPLLARRQARHQARHQVRRVGVGEVGRSVARLRVHRRFINRHQQTKASRKPRGPAPRHARGAHLGLAGRLGVHLARTITTKGF
jgi:hypothetical protein